MSNVSFSGEYSSDSEQSDISSTSFSFSSSSSSSLSSSSDSTADSSSSSSDSDGDSSSESVQNISIRVRVTMEESHEESAALESELSNAERRVSSLIESTDRISQMLDDINSITRYCEEIVSQTDNVDSTTTTSTPTVIQGRRRRLDVTPVEVIDLSNLEFAPPPPARRHSNRAPDAVIDLCTPDRSNVTHRRTSPPSIANAVVVDLDDPSPPKRSCPRLDQSQGEESYRCPVCLENVRRREPVSTKCGHVFCKECLVAAIDSVQKCPLCNKKTSQRQFTRIYL